MTNDHDRLFESHFLRVNKLADRSYGDVRPAYELGRQAATNGDNAGRDFDAVERDLESGWLNVRTANGDWASVREFAREGFERGRGLGFTDNRAPADTNESHDRPSVADPVPGNIDPTAPDSPEQTFDWQRDTR